MKYSQSEYSSEIDTSTLLAILSDFDLDDSSQVESARRTLDILKDTVEAEENTGFDASGSGGSRLLFENVDANHEIGSDSWSSKSPPAWSTDDASLSHAISSLDLGTSEHSRHITDTPAMEGPCYSGEHDDLDGEAKESLLWGMFPTLKPFDVQWALKKHKGDLNHIIDELMTQSFLDQTGTRRKGIEAFSESETSLPRKAKGKKKKNRQIENLTNSTTSEPVDKWHTVKKDIQFISSRSGMPANQVGSLYHKNGGSLRATISAIVEAHLALGLDSDGPLVQSHAIDMSHDFPAIPFPTLVALVQIGHPSITHSRELAEALAAPKTTEQPSIQIEFRRTPLQLDHTSAAPQTASPSAPYGPEASLESVTNTAMKYIQARDAAFSQAHAAYRKGKSDSLMGGAAAYYSQEGRDADARARRALSAAADRLAERQSWKDGIDLHGVTVEDAKRIAREKVTGWWHELGRDGQGVGAGYRIVTGVGNHSEGGVGKLGPAVGKMLIREGWKVQVGTGYLVVTGVAQKR